MPSSPTDARAPRPLLPWPVWRAVWLRRESGRGELVPWCALAALVGVGALYAAVARVCQWRGYVAFDPTTRLDALVPAVPWTIVLYATHFVYFPLALLAAPRSDAGRLDVIALVQAQIVLVVASCAFFLVFPAQIHLVDEMLALLPDQPGWVRALYAGLYSFDAPWNAWPSLHVSQSLLNVVALLHAMRDVPGRRRWLPPPAWRPAVAAVLWVLWVGLDVSILTTRQHFVLDLVTGLVVGALVLELSLRPALRLVERRGPEAVAREAFTLRQGYQESPT